MVPARSPVPAVVQGYARRRAAAYAGSVSAGTAVWLGLAAAGRAAQRRRRSPPSGRVGARIAGAGPRR